jgi:hypothetical protein
VGFGQVIAARLKSEAERVERARAEFNFNSIQARVPQGCSLLDVGAWSCYLGPLLRDRMGCEVLCLDVVNVNKTDIPFQVFDGRALPVDARSYDVVLLRLLWPNNILFVLRKDPGVRPTSAAI